MPYILSGTKKSIYTAMGQAEQFRQKSTLPEYEQVNQITIDFGRQKFLGTPEELKQYIQCWQDNQTLLAPYYMQGDMTAANAHIPFCANNKEPFTAPSDEQDPTQIQKIAFAFMDVQNIPCAVSIYTVVGDSSKWIIAFEKNTIAPWEDDTKNLVYILSSDCPKQESNAEAKDYLFSKAYQDNLGCELNELDMGSWMELARAIDHPIVRNYVSLLIQGEKLNSHAGIMELFCQNSSLTNAYKNNIELLNELAKKDSLKKALNNPVLHIAKKLNLDNFFPNQILKCLNPETPMHKFFLSLAKYSEKSEQIWRAKMYCWLDEWNRVDRYEILKDNLSVINAFVSYDSVDFLQEIVKDDIKFAVINFIFQNNQFSKNQQNILSGLQCLPKDHLIWQNLFQLATQSWYDNSRHAILCGFLLKHPEATLEEVKNLSNLLKDLPNVGDCIDSSKFAVDLINYKGQHINNDKLSHLLVKHITLDSAANLSLSNEEKIRKKKNNLKIIFKSILDIAMGEERSTLIKLALKAIDKDEKNNLRVGIQAIIDYKAKGYERLLAGIEAIMLCTELNITENYAQYLIKNDDLGEKIRRIVKKVESQCQDLKNHLGTTSKGIALNEVEKTYRKEIYQATINYASSLDLAKLKADILRAERKVLAITDQDTNALARYCLFAISNFIGLMFGGIPNICYYKMTGERFFYSCTESSGKVKKLGRQLIHDIESSAITCAS